MSYDGNPLLSEATDEQIVEALLNRASPTSERVSRIWYMVVTLDNSLDPQFKSNIGRNALALEILMRKADEVFEKLVGDSDWGGWSDEPSGD